MAYEVVMFYHLHRPSCFLGTFTEYPNNRDSCFELTQEILYSKSHQVPPCFFLLLKIS